MEYELIATAAFGIEAVVRRELEYLGFEVLKTEDGKVTFRGNGRDIARANIHLRSADRVLLRMAEFEAKTFEDLFRGARDIPWEELVPKDGKVIVNGSSVRSTLHSVPACQRIVKKAISERLGKAYGLERLPETGTCFDVKVTLLKDRATITVDTSGEGLHKRGYRVRTVEAPIRETVAAARVELSFWKPGRLLADPCCGSGTIAIEAAMIGKNIAPGLSRGFACEDWDLIPEDVWKSVRKEAFEAIDQSAKLSIIAADIDPIAVESAKENAIEAGVDDAVSFRCADIRETLAGLPNSGIMITNPPYGERIGDDEALAHIRGEMKDFFRKNKAWSLFVITTDKEFESRVFGRKADRRRKLYNGRLETCYYQFHGERPGEKRTL